MHKSGQRQSRVQDQPSTSSYRPLQPIRSRNGQADIRLGFSCCAATTDLIDDPLLLTEDAGSLFPIVSTDVAQALLSEGYGEQDAADEACIVAAQLAYAQGLAGNAQASTERLKQIVRSK